MLASGLRIGEALGLTWSNVDLEHRQLRVTQQVIETPRQPKRFGEPKSKSGKRTVPLIGAAVDALRAQRATVLERRLLLGSDWQDLDLVFPNDAGGFANSRNVEWNFKRLLARAGLPSSFTPHSLRHSTATYLGDRCA